MRGVWEWLNFDDFIWRRLTRNRWSPWAIFLDSLPRYQLTAFTLIRCSSSRRMYRLGHFIPSSGLGTRSSKGLYVLTISRRTEWFLMYCAIISIGHGPGTSSWKRIIYDTITPPHPACWIRQYCWPVWRPSTRVGHYNLPGTLWSSKSLLGLWALFLTRPRVQAIAMGTVAASQPHL